MHSIVVLQSDFLRKQGESASLFEILGHAPEDFLKTATANPSWELVPDGFPMSGEGIVLHAGAVGLTEDLLFRFYASDQKLLTDYYGNLGALKLTAQEAKSMEESFSKSFDAFVSDYFTLFAKEDQDLVLDELSLEIPVILDFQSLQLAEEAMAIAINTSWIHQGVRIDQPTLCRIAPEVTIGAGSHLTGMVSILGESRIGKHCRILGETYITNSILEDQVTVKSSVLEDAVMEEGSNMGPFAHLRPGASIGKKVHLGNFVEVKKARLDEGTKAGHLAYIGDAHVGKDVNISCGVIFCNYDGKNKHKAEIGDGSFLGSNSNLVAPLKLGKESFVAAGSTITQDGEGGELLIERAEEKHLPGYVQKRKDKGTL